MGGLKIKKTVVKGEAKSPQVLLVLGTTTIEGDLWVQLGTEEVAVTGEPDSRTLSELASLVGSKHENQAAPPPDAAFLGFEEKSLYEVQCEPGEALWVARFEFADHERRDYADGWENDLRVLWAKLTESAETDEAVQLSVTAWHTPKLRDWRREPEGDEARREVAVIGSPVHRRFPLGDIEYFCLFDLGLLFVHGIGRHQDRQTLIKFGEPLVEFWEEFYACITDRAAGSYRSNKRKRFESFVEKRALRNRADHQAAGYFLERFRRGPRGRRGNEPVHEEVEGVLCGGVRVEDTVFSSEGQPASSLTRHTLLGDDGKLREAHILMSEAWWTKKTIYPSARELFAWIWSALPIVLGMHLAGTLKPELSELRESLAERSLRAVPNLFVLLLQLVLLPVRFALAVCAQVVLIFLGVLSLAPIEWLKRAVREAIDFLMGTIGQSYALMTSPIRRNAIVRSVAEKLSYVIQRCDQVMIISHSQGAEITRLVLQAQRWPRVRKWITLGAGIKPLGMVGDGLSEKKGQWFLRATFLTYTTLVLLLVLARSILWLSGGDLWGVEYLFGVFSSHLWSILGAAGLVAVLVSLAAAVKGEPPRTSRFSRSAMEVWEDYFASHDPVSSGSLFAEHEEEIREKELPLPEEIEIHNSRSIIRDHTSYFKNVEQFVAPVALKALELAGLANYRGAADELSKAHARRKKLTWWRALWRYCAVVAFMICLAVAAFGPNGQWGAWEGTALEAWDSAEGLLPRISAVAFSGLIQRIVADLGNAFLVVIVYWVVDLVFWVPLLARSQIRLLRDLAGMLDRPRSPDLFER